MTTLISWVGVDSRGTTSIYIASDSRISWGDADKWDYGRKIFCSKNSPDIFGYCGDVLFPTQVLGQLIEQIDQSIIFSSGESFLERYGIVQEALQTALTSTPVNQRRSFQVVYVSRENEGMKSIFHACNISWSRQNGWVATELNIPNSSNLIVVAGTGSTSMQDWYERWQRSDIVGTSRSIFTAFCDSLHSGDDPLSGGAPQLVGIYRAGASRSFGIIKKGKRYLNGQELNLTGMFESIEWRNELFERCDGVSMSRLPEAQRQPKPIIGPAL